jgi:hypothetical protein
LVSVKANYSAEFSAETGIWLTTYLNTLNVQAKGPKFTELVTIIEAFSGYRDIPISCPNIAPGAEYSGSGLFACGPCTILCTNLTRIIFPVLGVHNYDVLGQKKYGLIPANHASLLCVEQ